MPIWLTVRRWVFQHFQSLTGRNLLMLFLGYISVSWLLYWIADETAIYGTATDFIYYLVVTASTVGYGDMSPVTPMGKWFALLFVIPAGLGLFAIVVGRLATAMADYWRRSVTGKRGLSVENHIVILGWNGQRTLHLVRMLQHEVKHQKTIVLCVRPEMENPLPGEVEFIRTETFTDAIAMEKACLSKADTILIDNPEDDVTLSSALYCASLNPNAHMLAYFNDEKLSDLLHHHCPNVECIPSVAVEMMAKAAIDPGSSQLHHELLATDHGMTQYAVEYPETLAACSVDSVFTRLKKDYDATLIGLMPPQGDMQLNPSLNQQITPGSTLFYIADERIPSIQW
ncbi:potassium channel family protein [Thaumasiovibrio subtropicus]|uniref:potassium channel family protein n=1 Tax=Thaumasiovibrio subtropicus TaxID=1891207 RepID=UPI000B3607A7|nr:potassium channel family protein [Thaumasiovibrio subtropicus]